jgi:hypothetical protein
MTTNGDNNRLLKEVLETIDSGGELSRRGFVKITLGAMAGLHTLGVLWGRAGAEPLIILDNAEGLVIGDPTKCVGCRRCELACTEFNDGKAAPAMARIKVGRNLNFGPQETAWWFRISASSVHIQCPVPMPAPRMRLLSLPALGPGWWTKAGASVAKCVGELARGE